MIGIVGRAGAGKGATAEALMALGFNRIKFATPLKQMLAAIGLSHDQIEGREKEMPTETLCGKTPRFAMQTLGTEWGRQIIGEDFWVNVWKERARQALHKGVSVVADDVRFPNEVEAIRRLGGRVVRVTRPGTDLEVVHESEAYADTIKADYVIVNSGTLEDLRHTVARIVNPQARAA